ncbi:hypothetical protein NW752_012012 [Fusarium irregulare]|nr:hypothetical protein NW752_012012 [Fusarium irregulare]
MLTSTWARSTLGIIGILIAAGPSVCRPDGTLETVPMEVRTGKWTDYNCTDPVKVDFPPYEEWRRWEPLQTRDAWDDAIRIWKERDRPSKRMTFTSSVATTLKLPLRPDCGLLAGAVCDRRWCSEEMNTTDSGPAAELLWGSFTKLNWVFRFFEYELSSAADHISESLINSGNDSAPIPRGGDDTYFSAAKDLHIWGAGNLTEVFFNEYLTYNWNYTENQGPRDSVQNATMAIVEQSITVANDMMSMQKKRWRAENFASFDGYVVDVIKGWRNANAELLYWIFGGSDESIDMLWTMISYGKLLNVGMARQQTEEDSPARALRRRTARMDLSYFNDLPPEQVEALRDKDAELTTSAPGPSISNQGSPQGIRKTSRWISPTKKKAQSSRRSPTESTLVPDNINDRVAEEHATAKRLRQERRKLWNRLEQSEELIEEYQMFLLQGVAVNGVTVEQRKAMCEELETEIARICDRLYDLGGELDAVAGRAHELLSKQMDRFERS